MKRPLRYVFGILIIFPVVMFSVMFLFGKEQNSGKDMFEMMGNVLPNIEENIKMDAAISSNISNAEVPMIKYTGGIQRIGTYIRFKEQILVYTDTGEKNGATEDGFVIYLLDIRTKANQSALEILSTEDIGAIQEIPAAFIYDKELDILYMHESGNYTVFVKVYGNNGTSAEYEFTLPVEIEV